MILTQREAFLLMICSVFYITLFIMVLKNQRRKILLLQSRLENIHQMQKLAVIERRPHDVQALSSAPAILALKRYLTDGGTPTENEWAAVTAAVDTAYPGFSEKLYSLYRMSTQDYRVSLLIKLRLQPKDIATLTAHSKESIASTRSRLYQKVFGKKGSTRDWDDFVLSI